MKKFIVMLFVGLLFAHPVKASDVSHMLDIAAAFVETGKPDSAAVLLYDLVNTIENTDERVRALYYLAMAMEQLGRIDEVIQYLVLARETAQIAEFADEVQHAYARTLLKTGNLEACIGLTEEFSARYPASPLIPDILYIAGNAYLLMGEYLRASNLFTEITKNYMNFKVASEAVMKEGVCLFKLKLISGGIERLDYYLSETPHGENADEALYFLGLAYESSYLPELAAEKFKRYTIEYPLNSNIMNAFFRLGKNYYESRQYIESENAFLNYINNSSETDENIDEALYYLERINFKTGKYSSETNIAENFITKYPASPRSPRLLFDLARYYRSAGRPLEAVDKYKILTNNPLYSTHADSATHLIADTYNSMGERDTAVDFLKHTSYEFPDSLRAQKMYLKIGILNEGWELYDEAIAWYDSSLALNVSPDLSFKALHGIGRIFRALYRLFESAKTFERIIGEYTYNPEIINI